MLEISRVDGRLRRRREGVTGDEGVEGIMFMVGSTRVGRPRLLFLFCDATLQLTHGGAGKYITRL